MQSFAARMLVDRVTLRDVARVARVSPSTVSLYVRGQPGVSRAMQDRIAAAIAELGYAPRARARVNHNRLVGLAVERLPLPVFSDIFYAEVIQGIEERAKALGLSVIFSVVEGQDLSRVMADQQAEGWLLLGGGNITDDQILAAQQTGVPIVLLDNYVRGAELDCVLPDNVRGGYAAFRHLLDLGHRRIAIIVAFIEIAPILWMFSTSLREPSRSFELPPDFLPTDWRWDNYLAVIRSEKINPGLLFVLPAVWGMFLINNCRMLVAEETGQL